MIGHFCYRRTVFGVVIPVLVAFASVFEASGSPNLVANGDLEQPAASAVGRASASGNEAIFSFPGEQNFGRVIARGQRLGQQLSKELVVAYGARTTAAGTTRGLIISGKEIKVSGDYEVAIWFDLNGRISPNRQYAYTVLCMSGGDQMRIPPLEMIVPAVWVDGELIGAAVRLEWGEKDTSAEALAKRGVVKTPDFAEVTGGQSLVLRLPKGFKDSLFIERVSLREIDEAMLRGEKSVVPTPTRYVDIVDQLERRIDEALSLSATAVKSAQTPQGYWDAGDANSENPENSVLMTALVLEALASRGEDMTAKRMVDATRWLAEQKVKKTDTVANRLVVLSCHAAKDHKKAIASDIQQLSDAQFDDGGWTEDSQADVKKNRALRTNNLSTVSALLGLREAAYAGFEVDISTWRKAATYWREAQAKDGGFRARLDKYGGLGEATTTPMTAVGLTGLMATLDMSFAVGGRTCNQYLANPQHLAGIRQAMQWMEQYYDEPFKKTSKLGEAPNPFVSVPAMVLLVELSGVHRFHNKDVFRTEADSLLALFDRNAGMFAGGLLPTAAALDSLARGAAPVVVQRVLVGGTGANEYCRDADHLVRYLRTQRPEPINWRATTMDRTVRELVTVPILYVNVLGPMASKEEHWRKVRDYCFAGGVVLMNVAEDAAAEREKIEAGLKIAFPEYALTDVGPDDAVLSCKHDLKTLKGLKAVGNGLKQFFFLTPEDWSCRLNTYQLKDRPEAFQFLDNLLTYTLDGDPPRSSFAVSTWDQGATTVLEVNVAHLEVGGGKPALPDLVKTLDRTMQSGYRLKVNEAPPGSAGAKLLWLSCAGDQPMNAEQRGAINSAIDQGAFVFAEVLTGRPAWVEAFRADLQKLDGEVHIRKLLGNHPIMTGQVPGTQGYDVRVVPLRKALRKEFEKLPRPDLYLIEKGGVEVGVLSVHDVGSGLGYMLYPDCRGVMPEPSRQIATNVVLYAMQRRRG